MTIIDAHQHFWNYDPIEHSWMTEEMGVIKRDFTPNDLYPILQKKKIGGTVLVQVTQSEKETETLLKISSENDFVRGVVGWVDLSDRQVERKLEYYCFRHPSIKGFRHILQSEEPEFMLRSSFRKGISLLGRYNLTFDILIYPRHLKAALKLVREFPMQNFVLDHLAKPDIKNKNTDEWKSNIRQIGNCQNVYCKISGMVTEAHWYQWNRNDFTPYIDIVVDAFGIDRVFYGSDWPMCLVAGSYEDVFGVVNDYFDSFSKENQLLFFSANAINFYKLS